MSLVQIVNPSTSQESLGDYGPENSHLSCRFTREKLIIESCKQLTLEEATENEHLFEALRLFSKAEYAEENLLFVNEVAKFKKVKSCALAEEIVEKFICDGAKHQINISYDVRMDILKNIGKYRRQYIDIESKSTESVFQQSLSPTSHDDKVEEYSTIEKKEQLDFTIFDDAYDVVVDHIKNETLNRFNESGALTSTTVIEPKRFGWLLIVLLSLSAVLFCIVGALSIYGTKVLRSSYENDIELEEQGTLILYYDEVLTNNARLFSYSADSQFRNRYDENSPNIDMAIANVDLLRPEINFASSVGEINRVLVELEQYAFENASLGNFSEAQAIFLLDEYLENKQALSNAINDLVATIDAGIIANSDKGDAIFISTIIIVCISLLYIIPTTIILLVVERQHTTRMIQLAKALEKNLPKNSNNKSF